MKSVAIFSLIIALSVAILSVFQFNKYQKFTVSAQTNLKKLEDEISFRLERSNKDIAALNEQEGAILTQMQDPTWKKTQIELKKLEDETKLKLEGIDKEITTLQAQAHTVLMHFENPAWKMDEVGYLLYLATARLQGIPNVKTAIDLLTTAQEKIKNLDDPKLVSLSQALTKDLKALHDVLPPNIEALWLKTTLLIDESTKLSPRDTILNDEKKEIAADPNTVKHAESWKQKLLNSLKEINELIKIQHHSKPIEPLLSEMQKIMISTNLRLLLEQVRMAILTEEQTLYQHAIQNAEQLLTTYYKETDPNVKKIQSALAELAQINLRPGLPIITSLELFNTLR